MSLSLVDVRDFLPRIGKAALFRVAFYAAALFVVTFAIWRMSAITQNLIVYQARWEPALSVACFGKIGFLDMSQLPRDVAAAARAKVDAFISPTPVPTFACSSLPTGIEIQPMSTTSNHLRFYYRYQVGLLSVVGVLWGLFGPSWELLGFFSSLMAAMTLLTLFAVARQFVGLVPAVALVAFVGFNRLFLCMIPQTRDFGKALFVISSFYILMRLVTSTLKVPANYILACAGLGALLGFGVGFRQDALSTALLSLVVLFLLPPQFAGDERLETAKTQGLGMLAFTAAFLIFAVPIYRLVPVDTSHEGHFLILGLFNGAMNYAGIPLGRFIFNPSYEDYSGIALVAAYGMADSGAWSVPAYEALYNSKSVNEFIDLVCVFPFILIGRVYAIAWDILTSGSYLSKTAYPVGSVIGGTFGHLFISTTNISAMLIALAWSRRLFLFLLLYLLAMSAMLSLQYMDRHFFHIHLVWFVMSVAIVLSAMFRLFRQSAVDGPSALATLFNGNPAPLDPRGRLRFAALILAGIVAFPLFAAVAQTVTIRRWEARIDASRFESAPAEIAAGPSAALMTVKLVKEGTFPNFTGKDEAYRDLTRRSWSNVTGGYLRARFGNLKDCGTEPIGLRIVYESKFSYSDLSHDSAVIPTKAGKLDYYVPAFFGDSSFAGIALNAGHLKCFEGLSWSREFPAIKLPVEFWRTR